MEWSREDILHGFDVFVFNYVPIRLIYVPEMKLVERDKLRSYIENDLQTSISNYQRFLKEGVTQARLDFKELIKYAIFSHRWLPSGEPTFDDLKAMKLPSGAGTQKLKDFCAKAKELGCMFAWSDTCCIDKSRSAELEESIRSMYRWYRNSHICIAYLADSTTLHDLKDDQWFTRGWTLQELIAPKRLKLFGKNFVPLTKDRNDKDPKSSALQPLSDISEIPVDSLLNFVPGLEKVRERLSWASRRQTTKIEDIAYCLVGLLDVSLPISYGEGNRAFFRLMQTVVQETSDSLIFAWTGMPSPYNSAFPLAPSGYRLTAALGKESSGASHEGGALYYQMANGYLKSKTLYFELKIKGETVRDKRTVITVTNPDLGDTEVVLARGAIAPALWGKFKAGGLNFWIINYDSDEDKPHGSLEVMMKQGRSYLAMLISFYRGQPERIGTENNVEVRTKTTLKHIPQPLFIHRLSYEAEGTKWPEIQLYIPYLGT